MLWPFFITGYLFVNTLQRLLKRVVCLFIAYCKFIPFRIGTLRRSATIFGTVRSAKAARLDINQEKIQKRSRERFLYRSHERFCFKKGPCIGLFTPRKPLRGINGKMGWRRSIPLLSRNRSSGCGWSEYRYPAQWAARYTGNPSDYRKSSGRPYR